MKLNSLLNSIILSIQLVGGSIVDCQFENSLFCPRLRRLAFFQYFKIIFNEYISNCLRLMANLSYVGFSLNRMSLIGKDHGKLVTYASKLSTKKFLCRFGLPCLALPVVKIFRFRPNFTNPLDDYPTPMALMFERQIKISILYLYLSFNLIADFINYILFLVINLVIDVCLVRKLRRTLNEKLEKGSSNKIDEKK